MSLASRISSAMTARTATNDDNDEEELDAISYSEIRNQQHRLFLLRHASQCTTEQGGKKRCKYIYCSDYKVLLEHILYCKEGSGCNVKNCVNSKLLIDHYNSCDDEECLVCGPVKEKIKEDDWAGVKRKLSFDAEFTAAVAEGTQRKLTF